jgi:hypothetical protein
VFDDREMVAFILGHLVPEGPRGRGHILSLAECPVHLEHPAFIVDQPIDQPI